MRKPIEVYTVGELAFTSLDVEDVLGWLAAGIPVHVVARRKACDPWHVEQLEQRFRTFPHGARP